MDRYVDVEGCASLASNLLIVLSMLVSMLSYLSATVIYMLVVVFGWSLLHVVQWYVIGLFVFCKCIV